MATPYRDTQLFYAKALILVFGFLATFLPLVATSSNQMPSASEVWSDHKLPGAPHDSALLPWILGAFVLFTLVDLIYAGSLIGPEKRRRRKGQEPDEQARRDQEWVWARWLLVNAAVVGAGLGLLAYVFRGELNYLIRRYVILDTSVEIVLASLLFLGVIMGFFVVRNWSKKQEDFLTSLTAVFGGAFISTLLSQLAGISLVGAFAHYALGFTVSGALNLLAFSRLVSNYSVTESKTSRALIDFLYGSDKADAIDKYFLKNFEEDQDYARSLLLRTLKEYRQIVLDEYADKMRSKRRILKNHTFCRLISVKSQVPPSSGVGVVPPATPAAAIGGAAATGSAEVAKDKKEKPPAYKVVYEELGDDKESLRACMFRMGISVRIGDNLEYIIAPGAYSKSFSFMQSVAGLSLRVRQTIVMDRDIQKKFRHHEFQDGKTPADFESGRGLKEIDFLSYISVPVVSHLGNRQEVALGVCHVDTKLFAVPHDELVRANPVQQEGVSEQGGHIFEANITLEDLKKWANALYAEDDAAVKYLETMRAVIVPILELYLKCRTGAL